MDEKDIKKLIIPFTILIFAILAFFVIKPIIVPILLGLFLAYLLNPIYKRLTKRIKSKYWSAGIILAIVSLLIIIPIILLIPSVIKQIFEFYLVLREMDFSAIITKLLPFIGNYSQMSAEIAAAASHFKASLSSMILTFFQSTLQNLPNLAFGAIILLFTFFFSLIESDKFKDYFSVLFPFPKSYQEKFYDKFEQITNSFLYGQLIVGIAQGLIAGLGYFLLGIPNALLWTIVTVIVGIIPVIGPWLVWIPLDLWLFVQGHTGMALGLLIYGLFVINWVDTLLRPRIVARKTQMNEAIALIGTIGGIYAFGIMGLIIGPLILAYLILLIEMYKDKDAEESIVIKKEKIP